MQKISEANFMKEIESSRLKETTNNQNEPLLEVSLKKVGIHFFVKPNNNYLDPDAQLTTVCEALYSNYLT